VYGHLDDCSLLPVQTTAEVGAAVAVAEAEDLLPP